MVTNIVCKLFGKYLAVFLLLCLAACASGPDKPKATDLGPDPALLGVRKAWVGKIGVVDFPLEVPVIGNFVALASSDGTLASIDSRNGAEQWRVNVGAPISAGVGSDGRYFAVVTRGNELVVFEGPRELWRMRLTTQVFTSPLVAGGRVFVLGADRSVMAFDAQSSKKLWQNQRPGDALVLRQSGVLTAVQNTLVVGLSGHLLGLNPVNGTPVWDAPIATPRGTNDIERLVDLVAGISRNANTVCVRAFQAAVGCVDASRGSLIWKLPANGAVGLQGDDKQVYGVEDDGRLVARKLATGELVWSSDRLRFRHLSAPVVVGRSVAIGDESGVVHLMARADGAPLTRLVTDGSAVSITPVLAVGSLVVVTHNGGIFGFQPE
jgi:outer membrane assembly lipoprotein YfgL